MRNSFFFLVFLLGSKSSLSVFFLSTYLLTSPLVPVFSFFFIISTKEFFFNIFKIIGQILYFIFKIQKYKIIKVIFGYKKYLNVNFFFISFQFIKNLLIFK